MKINYIISIKSIQDQNQDPIKNIEAVKNQSLEKKDLDLEIRNTKVRVRNLEIENLKIKLRNQRSKENQGRENLGLEIEENLDREIIVGRIQRIIIIKIIITIISL